jgi:hypothetical protein
MARDDQLDRVGDASRLISEAFMPSVPIAMPSVTLIVLNSIGVPPAARMPSFTFSASFRWFSCRA